MQDFVAKKIEPQKKISLQNIMFQKIERRGENINKSDVISNCPFWLPDISS